MSGKIAGVILAGGQSRRMGGGDKCMLPLGGSALLDRVVSRLSPQVGYLALNANGDAARFDRFGLPVIADTVAGFAGPLAGILAGLEWAAANTQSEAVVTAAGDTPFLPENLVERLGAVARTDAIAVARSAGKRHPVFALWPLSLRGALAQALDDGERRVSAFIDHQDFVEVDFPLAGTEGHDPFFNINTPDDLAAAERLLGNPAP